MNNSTETVSLCTSCGVPLYSFEKRVCNRCHRNESFLSGIFRMETCPTCKRDFVVPPLNTYKRTVGGKDFHFCKYTCMTKAEREIPLFVKAAKARRGSYD